MDWDVKACAECTQTCCLIHGKNESQSRAVTTFFKIMIGDKFSKLLLLPPKFSGSVPVRDGQKAILEDSSGQIWEVKFHKSNDCLVLEQGWSTFASDHNLQAGELVLFFLAKEWHFVVKIYDRTSCEKVIFSDEATRTRTMKRKRKRKRKRRQISRGTTESSSDSDVVILNSPVPAHKEDRADDMDFMVGRGLDGAELEVDRRWSFDLSVFEDWNSPRRFQIDEWAIGDENELALIDHDHDHDERRAIGDDDDDDDDDDGNELAKEVASEGNSDKGSTSFAAFTTLLATSIVNPQENDVRMTSTDVIESLNDQGSKENISNIDIKERHVIEGINQILPSRECNLDDEDQDWTEKGVNSGTCNILENCQPVSGDKYNLDYGNEECTGKYVNMISGTFNTPTSGAIKNCKHEQIMKSNQEEIAKIETDPSNNKDTEKPHEKKVMRMEILNEGKAVETKVYSQICKTIQKLGEESSSVAECPIPQSVDTATQDHEKVHPDFVKIETVDFNNSFTTTTTTTTTTMTKKKKKDPIKFHPMLATCTHRHFIELPGSLPFPTIKGKANLERKMVYLRSSDMEIFPVVFHEKEATRFLSIGWEDLTKANRIKSGDKCLFAIDDEAEGIYSFRVLPL